MFDLNDVHRAFGLPKNKLPHQWRHRVRTDFAESAELRAGTTTNGALQVHHTWASEDALYAYAMWCDTKFYRAVLKAFRQLARGELEEAQETAEEVVCAHTERAIGLYGHGRAGGFALRAALENVEQEAAPIIKKLDEVARGLPVPPSLDVVINHRLW